MRHCLVITSLLVAAMIVGCQTQTWKDTDVAPGAGRGDNIFQVHGGLFEVSGSLAGSFSAGGIGKTAGIGDGDFESIEGRGSLFFGYMINDYWQVGAFGEYGFGTWEPDDDDFDDIDYDGSAIGGRVTYNFSNVGTDVVPYCEISGGFGGGTLDSDEIDDEDVDFFFGQAGMGVRLFAWDGIAWGIGAFYRYTEYETDEDSIKIRKNDPGEFGGLISLSWFF